MTGPRGTGEPILHWLASPDVPPVRFLLARDYDFPDGARDRLEELHAEVLRWAPLRKILSVQKPDGSFPNQTKTQTGGPTLTALVLMARCAMRASDEPVRRALDHVTAQRLHEGVFTMRGRGSGVLPCYVGMFARAVADLAGPDHPLVATAVSWITDYQRFDHRDHRRGGAEAWPHKLVSNYGGCWSSVSCYHGVVPTLRALAAVPSEARTPEIEAALDNAIAYLRIHRVYKKSTGDKPIFRHSTNLYLYGAYRSNLLDTLEGLADARPALASEPWVREALDTLERLEQNGKLVADESYRTEIVDPLPLEPAGEPSRFLTYQWLRVKDLFAASRAS